MKNFVKAMDKRDKDFENLREKFPKFSVAKLKGAALLDPQIREIINDDIFEHLLTKEN